MERKIKTVFVDLYPKSYDVRLSKGWAGRMMDIARPFQRLDDAIFEFTAEMRAIAHTARLPYDMLRSLESFHNGRLILAGASFIPQKLRRKTLFAVP